VHETQIDRQLRGQRTGRDLRQSQPFLVVGVRYPVALFHQVAVHEAHQRDRTAEAQRAQAQEIQGQLPEGIG